MYPLFITAITKPTYEGCISIQILQQKKLVHAVAVIQGYSRAELQPSTVRPFYLLKPQ